MLESVLSQSRSPDQWTRLDSYCRHAQRSVHLGVKEKQTRKFDTLKLQQFQRQFPKFTLDHSKLVVNLSTRTLPD